MKEKAKGGSGGRGKLADGAMNERRHTMRQVPQGASSLLPTVSEKDGRGGLGGKPSEPVEKRVPEPRGAFWQRSRPSVAYAPA